MIVKYLAKAELTTVSTMEPSIVSGGRQYDRQIKITRHVCFKEMNDKIKPV